MHLIGTNLDDLLRREWLAVNHLGGYASSTPGGLNTRKYHGLLVAAMLPPVRRMVLLSRLEETIHAHGASFHLSTAEYSDSIHPRGFERLVAFDSSPYPRWAYQGDGWTVQKELHLLPLRNAVLIQYTLLGCNSPVMLDVRPFMAMRGIHELMYQSNSRHEIAELKPGQLRIDATNRTPEIYLAHDGVYESQPLWNLNNIYRQEEDRGYAALEDLWTPGMIRWKLSPGRSVHFVCSADPILLDQAVREANDLIKLSIDTPPALESLNTGAKSLFRAAATFIPVMGDNSPASRAWVVTQYPWSPPSGRDALIALPGLFLSTRRFQEAAALLDASVADLAGGVLPSVYPEDGSFSLYDGADVALWFIHAVDRFLDATGEKPAARPRWIEAIEQIIEAYRVGTEQTSRLGIQVDRDGLISAHASGLATTWMDAKCGDWVVTPRAGKAVELNALWHNGLCAASMLMRSVGQTSVAEKWSLIAASIRPAFNRTFWNAAERCCFDVVGETTSDDSLRPNQLLALSLPYPVLEKEYHAAVLNSVRNHLLTPLGIRTLAPNDSAYCEHYRGNPVARDRAQHQGSVYPWLLGAFADAMIRVQGDHSATRSQILQTLTGCIEHLQGPGLGHLPELFDGTAPHKPGGAIASARSLGEVLRAYMIASPAEPTAKSVQTSQSVPNPR